MSKMKAKNKNMFGAWILGNYLMVLGKCSIKRGNCRVGLPSPSRDRDGIGRRELPETCFCLCNILEIEVVEIKHCKSGLGQGFYTRPQTGGM